MNIKAKDLKELIGMTPDDYTISIDSDGMIISHPENDDELYVGDQDHIQERLSESINNNYPSVNEHSEIDKKHIAQALVGSMLDAYDENCNAELAYNPVVYTLSGEVLCDNKSNEQMIANNCPALYATSREIRNNNEGIARLMGQYAYQATKGLLEYLAQANVNASDAAVFDGEMRQMCDIIKEKE